jgi:hypothetical protein
MKEQDRKPIVADAVIYNISYLGQKSISGLALPCAFTYPFAGHAIHLRGLAKVSLNALPRFSSTFEYDTKRCVE